MHLFSYFLTKARNWTNTSALTPSSHYVVEWFCNAIDFRKSRLLIEFGPGNGVITKQLLNKMHIDAKLIAIEVNKKRVSFLNRTIDDPRFSVLHGNAVNVQKILNDHGIYQIDCVVSAIPFFWMSPEIREKLIACTYTMLRPGGEFFSLQMFYLTRRYLRNYLEKYFAIVNIKIEYRNLPPLRLYRAVKSLNLSN